ncbi:MAG: DUF296 domain-containing protein [Thermoplasmata archaeon]|nr:DUF296 domain-containing protein [Thermoplasmata archaeon]
MQEARSGEHWMVRLSAGEEVHPALSEFAERHAIRAGVVEMGIGMFGRATIGYWNGQEYDALELAEPHEVVALHGSIASDEGRPSLHLHAGLANSAHALVGGHLIRATVSVLLELSVSEFKGLSFARPFDESFGLRMLDLRPSGRS